MMMIVFKWLLIVVGCLFAYLVIYDCCVKNERITTAFKKELIRFLSNRIFYVIIIGFLIITIIYLVYLLIWGHSLF